MFLLNSNDCLSRQLKTFIPWSGTSSLVVLLICFAIFHPNLSYGANKKQLHIDDYTHLQWRTFENEQFPSIFDLAQDSQGFIWLATYDGLIRFDGVDFIRVLTNNDADIFQKYVSNLEIGTDDSVWFIPFNTGLARLQHGRLELFNINHGLMCDTINQITIGPKGKLWYACDQGIGYFDNDQFHKYADHDGTEITALLIESDQQLWYGNTNGAIYQLKDDHQYRWTAEDGSADSAIQAIYRHPDGHMLIGSRSSGIYQLENGKISQPQQFAPAKNMSIEDIISDKFGALWFGTNKGIVRFEKHSGQMQVKLLGKEAIEGARGKALLTDNQGNIWAGFYAKGLHQLIYPKINVISNFDSIFYAVRAVTEYQDAYWIGTDNGGITIKSHDGGNKQLNTSHGLPSNTIHTLFPDQQGNLWIGSSKGISKYTDGQLTHFDLSTIGISNWVTAITESDDGHIWVGSDTGIATIKDNQILSRSNQEPRTRQRIRWISQTQSKEIWVGTFDGVLIWRDGKWRQPPFSALSSKSHRSFYQDQDGGMWFGSLVGEGLHWLKNGQLRAFTTKDGLFDNYMWTIAEDQQGYLWMISDKGISKVKRSELENYYDSFGNKRQTQPLHSTVLGSYEGLEVSECNGSSPGYAHTKAGKLIFPCMVGLVEIDPNDVVYPVEAPKNIIDFITMGNQRQWQPQDIVLEPQQRDFHIHYTAIGYDNPDKIKFRYRLIGYKDNWQPMNTRRNVSFTNLSAGEYRFEVTSKFYNGQWGKQPASFNITIKPYFYESWWFTLGWSIATIICGVLWYKRRVKALIARIKEIDNAKLEYLGTLIESIAHNLQSPVDAANKGSQSINEKLNQVELQLYDSGLTNTPLQQLNNQIAENNQQVLGEVTKIAQIIEMFKQLNIENYHEDVRSIDLDHMVNSIKIDCDINHPERTVDWDINQNAGPSIVTYPHVIEQIIAILIDNTLTHGYPNNEPAKINLSFELKQKRLRICYQDQGRGIAAKQRANLFMPFNQNSSNKQGLGLGMNMVYNLITHKLLGQIELLETTQSGVCFIISFDVNH